VDLTCGFSSVCERCALEEMCSIALELPKG